MTNIKRKNLKDIWNFNLTNSDWENDICNYTAKHTKVNAVYSIMESVELYKRNRNYINFHIDGYIYFSTADINRMPRFNTWNHLKHIAKVSAHFDGIIAPYYMCNYSKRNIRHNINVYMMQVIGKHFTDLGQNVIYSFITTNKESYLISQSGIQKNSTVYIDIHNYENDFQSLDDFKYNIDKLIDNKSPSMFVLIGDKSNPKFSAIKETGIPYTLFEDNTAYSFIETIWQRLEKDDTIFNDDGYPICIPTKQSIPSKLISWREAVRLYNLNKFSNPDFKIDAYVHFYIDDQDFDGPLKGIWCNPDYAYKILKHFRGIITADFSTYQDFPVSVKQWAVYRMALTGILANKYGIEVINNLRIDYFDAYPSPCISNNEIISIGTVASGLKKKFYKDLFNDYFFSYFLNHPCKEIIVFGSSNYKVFRELNKRLNIPITSFKSNKAKCFEGGDE